MRSVELFAGAGGLALGVSQAGFHHEAVVELDRNACDTIRLNQKLGVDHVRNWTLREADVRSFDFEDIPEDIDLLAAGVPCQPWSIGGKHRGFGDERNLFPETVRAVLRLRPKAILIENVRGLTRHSFANYFTYIQWMLRFPELKRKPLEEWTDHRKRLERYVASDGRGYDGLRYNVLPKLVNAADYGVPQLRERVFIVALRDDLGIKWSFPEETHSQKALWVSQWVTGEYWDGHKIPKGKRPAAPDGASQRGMDGELFAQTPWLTVRDALEALPDPLSKEGRTIPNHVVQPGAKPYAGHTGSPLDEPAKTLKAGDHGVPGGENMMVFPDGRVRYFTVREAAELQTFPREFVFGSSWSENMRQIGNAVPARLARIVAEDIRVRLSARFPR